MRISWVVPFALSIVLGAERPADTAETLRVMTLAEATDRALATHEKVAGALAERRGAEVGEWKAWTSLAPSLDAAGTYTRNKDAISFPESLAAGGGLNPLILQKEALRGAFTVSQPVLAPQFWAQRDIGAAVAAAADEALRAAREDVTLAVAEAYYGMLRGAALAEVAREGLELAELEREHARSRADVGDALKSDLLRAETEVERARQRQLNASGSLEAMRNRLLRLVGTEESFQVAEPPAPRVDLRSVEPFLAAAKNLSPEVRRAQSALDAAKAEERRQRAAFFPTLGLRFQYRVVDPEAFAEQSDFWEFVAGIQLPLFAEGGAQWVGWQQQRARVDKAEVSLREVRRDAELGVRDAFIAAETLAAQEAVAAKEEALAVESHRVLSESYQEGAASSVDLLTALNARSAANVSYATVRYDRQVALLRLLRAAGLLGEAPPAPYESVVVTDEEIVPLRLEQAFFDGASLKPSARATLDDVARVLLENPRLRLRIRLQEEDGPGRSEAQNAMWQTRRAAIVNHLLAKGVVGERIVIIRAEDSPVEWQGGRAAQPGDAPVFRIAPR